ncbi:hypothetical protein HaLaN_20264 [Haematococcus lacustris]|uniref:Uncharacterized protein n=1 Tax=Haematococcus lacustris TaxID=44745 RepID=A0A6A0A1C6_HAELA|nr:hypothetical protein HaLaN_20264 [Haematococcus lacustris]
MTLHHTSLPLHHVRDPCLQHLPSAPLHAAVHVARSLWTQAEPACSQHFGKLAPDEDKKWHHEWHEASIYQWSPQARSAGGHLRRRLGTEKDGVKPGQMKEAKMDRWMGRQQTTWTSTQVLGGLPELACSIVGWAPHMVTAVSACHRRFSGRAAPSESRARHKATIPSGGLKDEVGVSLVSWPQSSSQCANHAGLSLGWSFTHDPALRRVVHHT